MFLILSAIYLALEFALLFALIFTGVFCGLLVQSAHFRARFCASGWLVSSEFGIFVYIEFAHECVEKNILGASFFEQIIAASAATCLALAMTVQLVPTLFESLLVHVGETTARMVAFVAERIGGGASRAAAQAAAAVRARRVEFACAASFWHLVYCVAVVVFGEAGERFRLVNVVYF